MTDELHQTFAQLLRQARREAGLTQEELAERAGISPRAVSSLERGINRAPRRDTLELIFTALDLPREEQARWERVRKRLSVRPESAMSSVTASRSQGLRLPESLTSFLGREQVLSEIHQVLTKSRLVTLTGPGGVGKTRLGITVAGLERHRRADGVFFVPLAQISHPDLVIPAIVRALGIDETARLSAFETLVQFLRERSALLLLDNFEHVVSAATEISQILEACSQLTVLVTSRVPLRVRGEREYPVRSMPDDAAAQLFVERSRDVRPDFAPDDAQSAAIVEICKRLDCLPLAIELAAARGKLMPPNTLLARLDHPLSLLTSGPRDLPDRQQTLRATIAWSYDLIDPEAQHLFQTLSVFIDGWSLEAAEYMVEGDVTDGLTALVDMSLVEQYVDHTGEPRFRMLETIREYGLEQLVSHDNLDSVERHHASYFSELVMAAPPFILGPDQVMWLNRLETEHADIQRALDWHLEHDVRTGLQMAASLWRFWWMRCHLTIGKRYFDRLLERADDSIAPATLAAALTGAGVMTLYESDLEWERAAYLHEQALSIWLDLQNPPEGAWWSYICLGIIASRNGNLQEAETWYLESLEYARRHNQPYGILGGHLLLGNHLIVLRQFEQAMIHYQYGLSIAREFRDPWSTAMNSGNLGGVLIELGQYDEARSLITEALYLSRQLDHARGISAAVIGLADIELKLGHLTEAADLYAEGLMYAEKSGETRSIGFAKLGLAEVAIQSGDFAEAFALFRQTLHVCRAAGELTGIASSLGGLAIASFQFGNVKHAVQLHAATDSFCERVGIPKPESGRTTLRNSYVTVQQALTAADFEEAWEAGYRLTPEQIVLQEAHHDGRA